MWIETREVTIAQPLCGNSFASNGECGLKQPIDNALPAACLNSFASNGECGLKPVLDHGSPLEFFNSFASNGECGLKQLRGRVKTYTITIIHSPAMANVD